MSDLTVVLLIVGAIVLWGCIYWYRSEGLFRKYNGQTHFSVGKYLVGLEDHNDVADNVECVVGSDDFIFAKMGGMKLGSIPRDAVEDIAIDDKSQITQRLTVTRMVAFGVFSLAGPKKTKIGEWCIGVRWKDGKGFRRVAVFEFTGANPERDANEAANLLMRYAQPPTPQTEEHSREEGTASSGSKTCPYCAETIKAAAVVCRFCGRELSSTT